MPQKDNSGALFKNKRKEQDKHPDYTGPATIGGVEYRMAAWLRQREGGEKYMSLAFTEEKEDRPQAPPAQRFEPAGEKPF